MAARRLARSALVVRGARKLLRYGLAAIGPVGSAGAQFLLSVQMLHVLSPQAFGGFSFLLVASQFTTGLWSALFCAPLSVLLARGGAAEQGAYERCLMTASLLLALIFALAFCGVAFGVGTPHGASLMFGVYGAAFLVRWFARAYAYATGSALRTTASDILYSLCLVAGVALMTATRSFTLEGAYAALLASALFGLLPFGRVYLRKQLLDARLEDIPRYRLVWNEHASWSTTGVMTTEATANAHAYIVTFLRGATAFAPLAASALLMRPIGVVSNALSEMERPQMARQLAAGRRDEALRSISIFRMVLIAAWFATAVGAWGLWRFVPGVIFPPQYERTELVAGVVLWLAIAGVRMVRAPDSVLLQAAGQFRSLAQASMISCGVSLVGVTLGLLVGGSLWSLPGILMGEVIFAAWVWRQKRLWLSV